MIELEYKGEVIELSEEMTIGQYQVYENKRKYYDENPISLLSLFTGIPVNEIKNMSKEEVQMIDIAISSKLEQPQEKDLIMVFTYKGVDYGLENDWQKLAWGAWVDLEVYSSENLIENIHLIMSVLYRPVVKYDKKNVTKYTIEPYDSNTIEERAQLFKNLNLSYWLSCASFFFLVVNLYMNNIENSLKLEKKINQKIMQGWKVMPKFLQKRLPLDSILVSLTNSQKKILPK